MKTSEGVTRHAGLSSSAAGAFTYDATGDPSAFIEIFGDQCIIIDEVVAFDLEEALPRKRARTGTEHEPNETSKRAQRQLKQGDLIEYDSLEAFKDHLRNI